MEQKELEFTKEMLERNDVLDNAVYKMCLTFLQFEEDENLDVKFPWDISILGEIRDLTVELLREKGILCAIPALYATNRTGIAILRNVTCIAVIYIHRR